MVACASRVFVQGIVAPHSVCLFHRMTELYYNGSKVCQVLASLEGTPQLVHASGSAQPAQLARMLFLEVPREIIFKLRGTYTLVQGGESLSLRVLECGEKGGQKWIKCYVLTSLPSGCPDSFASPLPPRRSL